MTYFVFLLFKTEKITTHPPTRIPATINRLHYALIVLSKYHPRTPPHLFAFAFFFFLFLLLVTKKKRIKRCLTSAKRRSLTCSLAMEDLGSRKPCKQLVRLAIPCCTFCQSQERLQKDKFIL